jgi:hypothetical protein
MDEVSRTTVSQDEPQIPAEVHELKTTRRGSKRPGYTGTSPTLAAATNDPIALIKTNIARNADARRWRDLMLHYQNRIGDTRFREESVRVRVLALVNATLELERLTDGLVAGHGGKLLQKRNYDSQGHPRTLIYERGDPPLADAPNGNHPIASKKSRSGQRGRKNRVVINKTGMSKPSPALEFRPK